MGVDTAKQGAQDALTIRTNAYRNYDDVRNQAVSYRNQASLYDMQASNSCSIRRAARNGP